MFPLPPTTTIGTESPGLPEVPRGRKKEFLLAFIAFLLAQPELRLLPAGIILAVIERIIDRFLGAGGFSALSPLPYLGNAGHLHVGTPIVVVEVLDHPDEIGPRDVVGRRGNIHLVRHSNGNLAYDPARPDLVGVRLEDGTQVYPVRVALADNKTPIAGY